ncbi:hypothetical protein DFH09DRAFT_1074569 [Mycena vulgaris]|nr:hypothetical protein DFH09DRAFT_1074569 [Mycena vulgaris]
MDLSFGRDSSFLGANPVLTGSSFIFDTLSAPLLMTKTPASGSGSKMRKHSEPDAESEDATHGAEGGGAPNDGPNTLSTAARTAAPPPKRRSRCAATVAPESSPSGPSSVKTPKGKSMPALSKSKVKVSRVIIGSLVSKPPQAPHASSSTAPVQPPQPPSPKRPERPDLAETFLGKVIPTDPHYLPAPFIIEDANDASMFFHLEPPIRTFFSTSPDQFMRSPITFFLTETFRTPEWRETDDGQYLCRVIGECINAATCLSRVCGVLTTLDRFLSVFPPLHPHVPSYSTTENVFFDDPDDPEPVEPPTEDFVPPKPPPNTGIKSAEEREHLRALAKEDFDAHYAAWEQREIVAGRKFEAAMEAYVARWRARFESYVASEQLYVEQVDKYNAQHHDILYRHIRVLRSLGELGLLCHIRPDKFFETFVPPPLLIPGSLDSLPSPVQPSPSTASLINLGVSSNAPPPPVPPVPAVSREPSVAPSVTSRHLTSIAGSQFDPEESLIGDEFNFGEGDEEDELEDSPAPRSSKGKGKVRTHDTMDADDNEGKTDGGSKLARKGAKRTRRRDLPGCDPQTAVPVLECFDKKRTVDINPLSYQPFHHSEPMSEGGKRSSDGTLINTGGFRSSSRPGFEGFFDGFEDEQIPVSAAGPIVYFTRGSGCKKCKKGEPSPQEAQPCGTFATGTKESPAIHIPEVFEPPALAEVAFVAASADLKFSVSDRFTDLFQAAEEQLLSAVGDVPPKNHARKVISGLVDVCEGFPQTLREHLALLDRCNFPDTDALVRSMVEELAAAPPGTTRSGAVGNGGMGEGSRGFLEDEDAEGELVDESGSVDTGFLGVPPAAATPGAQKSGKGFPLTPKVSNSATFLDFPFGSHGSAPLTPSLLRHSFSGPSSSGMSFGPVSGILGDTPTSSLSGALTILPLSPLDTRPSTSPRKSATPGPNGQKLA